MRRGSSKDAASVLPGADSETLPLSAFPGKSESSLRIEFDIIRGARSETRWAEVPRGTPLRRALRAVGQAPEGSAVLRGSIPLPLDTVLTADERLTVLSTFSGG